MAGLKNILFETQRFYLCDHGDTHFLFLFRFGTGCRYIGG